MIEGQTKSFECRLWREKSITTLTAAILIAFLFSILLTSWLYATSFASIEGYIADDDNKPVVDVFLTIYGSGFPGIRQTVSNENGYYRFNQLPPGEYVIETDKTGYHALTTSLIEVNDLDRLSLDLVIISKQQSGPILLNLQPIPQQHPIPASGMIIDRNFYERLPIHDHLEQVFLMPSGITGETYPFIRGSTHVDNVYFLDGFEIDDPLVHLMITILNEDSIEYVSVLTGALPAEFGGMMGGQVSIETKRGGDTFHGIVRYKYSTDYFNPPSDAGKPDVEVRDHFEPTISFSGPIVNDKAWFFISYRYHWFNASKDVRSGRNVQDGLYDYSTVENNEYFQSYSGRLTWAVSPDNMIDLTFAGDPKIYNNAGDTRYSPEAQFKYQTGTEMYGLRWSSLLSPTVNLQTSVGYYRSYYYIDPQHDNDRSAVYDRRSHIWYENFYETDHLDRTRFSLVSKVNIIKNNWFGDHEFTLGAGFQQHVEDHSYDFTTGRYYLIDYYGTEKEQPYRRYHLINWWPDIIDGNLYSLFVQDFWEINSCFAVQVGLRWDYSEFRNKMDETVARFEKMLAPRIAISYTIDEHQQKRIHGSIGRYYNPYDLYIIQANPGPSPLRQTWIYDPDHPDSDEEGYYLACGYSGEEIHDIVDPNLKPEHTDEYSIGYSEQIISSLSVGANIVYRHTQNVIEDVGFWYDTEDRMRLATDIDMNDQDAINEWYAQGFYQYYWTNPDDAFRDYYGLELFSSWRTDQTNLDVSYTYSETRGTITNYPNGNYFKYVVVRNSLYFDTPYLSNNIEGKLYYDVTHFVKLHAVHQLPYDFFLGTRMYYRSGYPYSKYGTDEDLGHTDPHYDDGVRFIGERGSYRYPDVFQVDLSIQKDLHIGKWGSFTAIVDVINLFNNQVVISRDENEGPSFGQDLAWKQPTAFTFHLKYAF